MRPDLLDELYHTYYEQAYAYAFSLCKSREEAEDIVADAFVKALLSCEKAPGDFLYWLLVVCRNLWVDRQRRGARLQAIQEEIAARAGEDRSPEARAIWDERSCILMHCILSLPTQYREVLSLHYYAGIPATKIAQILHLSYANVKTTLHRGREKLKKELEENGYAL